MTDHPDHAPDGGFSLDLPRLLSRRRALALGAAAAFLPTAASAAGCALPAAETAGPFPANGTNRIGLRRVNVLAEADVLREDIRPSFAGLTGTADGVATTLEMTLTRAADCTPLVGAAVYVWQCDAGGRYSLYEIADRNYLRGLGVTDGSGTVRFTTVFPGCYPGRWPHIHFEVFASAEAAAGGEDAILTSQLALDGAVSAAIYAADPRYAASVPALSRLTLAGDGVFRNNSATEMAAMTAATSGDMATGLRLTAAFAVPA
jgi:protocatechuate 3,4-dioxygenase beta subunit